MFSKIPKMKFFSFVKEISHTDWGQVCHFLLCVFISGSYSKTSDLFPIIIRIKNFCSLSSLISQECSHVRCFRPFSKLEVYLSDVHRQRALYWSFGVRQSTSLTVDTKITDGVETCTERWLVLLRGSTKDISTLPDRL